MNRFESQYLKDLLEARKILGKHTSKFTKDLNKKIYEEKLRLEVRGVRLRALLIRKKALKRNKL